MDWVGNTIALVIAIILHEIGHYVAFYTLGYKPRLKLRWWAISIGEEIAHKLKVIELMWVLYIGITVGLLYFMVVSTSTTFLLLYLLFASNDINLIFMLATTSKDKKQTVLEFQKIKYKELIANATKSRL